MGILRANVQEHGRIVPVQLSLRVRAGGPEKMRGQQPDATVSGVLRAGQERHEDGLQVPEPGGGGERDLGQRHGLPLRVQHAVLVGRQAEEDPVDAAAGREEVRPGRERDAGGDHVAGDVGTRVGGGGLGEQQAVRGGRGRAESGRVRAERPVARDRAQQQPDQPVGHRAGPHAGVHVHRGREPAGPGQHGRRRHESDRHGRRVQGVRGVRGHPRRPPVLVRLAVGLHRDGGLRRQRQAPDTQGASGPVAVSAGRVRKPGVLVGRHETGLAQREQVRPDHGLVRLQEPGHQRSEIGENRPPVGAERR